MTQSPAPPRRPAPSESGAAAPRRCPVCGEAERLSVLCRVDGYDILACATCSAEHAAPMPSAAELKAFYDRPAWFEGGEKGGYDDYDAQTVATVGMVKAIFDSLPGGDISVLDVGCGYGTHLQAAAARGWKCFGVELSDHARAKAKERLGGAAYIVASVDELIPHEFDVVLLLDVIEHVPSPYGLLYRLFSIGAITPKTLVVIATPNAGSAAARRDPAAWEFRHPPSHLVYYTAAALTFLLRRLHFTRVELGGTGAADAKDLAASPGLRALASGSDFMQFMHERYVPGTWSRIAAYEHVPRYAMAQDVVAGKTVLDFGCGTGYGAAMLAARAARVTGLDIDEAALAWARETHALPNLDFIRRDNLGADLPAESFDVITCFEMIEHVDHATQQAVIASFARLLKPTGVMFISTPNPEKTKLYGANPYHIREMSAAELRALVAPHFAHVQVLRQHVRAGVTFAAAEGEALAAAASAGLTGTAGDEPLAFVAVCAKRAPVAVAARVFFDDEVDYIADTLARQKALDAARFEAYAKVELAHDLQRHAGEMRRERDEAMSARVAAEHARDTATHEANLARQAEAEAEHLRAQAEQARAAEEQARLAAEQARAAEEQARLAAEQARAAEEQARLAAEREQLRLTVEFDALARRREIELSSPRFLARQTWAATKRRIRRKLRLEPAFDFAAQDGQNERSLTELMARAPAMPATAAPLLATLVIPTKNGGALFQRAVAAWQRQSLWPQVELIVIDSGSSDDTVAIAEAAGANVMSVAPADFNHGTTRDAAVAAAQAPIVILSVQDAVPLHDQVIERLLAAFADDAVAGAYARQHPQPDARLITKRTVNASPAGQAARVVRALASAADFDALAPLEKFHACTFDNVCSAIRKSVWEATPFGAHDFGEDIAWAERVLKQGRKIVYEPAAAVLHSHDRSLADDYRRAVACHRHLARQFGLRLVPSFARALRVWVTAALVDMTYAVLVKAPLTARLRAFAAAPARTAARVFGQYRGARDAAR